MQTLKLADKHFPAVRDHQKRVTIRKGYRDVKPGPMLLESATDGFDSIEVMIGRVIFTPAGEMTDKEARQDGFRDLTDLIRGMKEYYPDFDENTEVTIIHFWPEFGCTKEDHESSNRVGA